MYYSQSRRHPQYLLQNGASDPGWCNLPICVQLAVEKLVGVQFLGQCPTSCWFLVIPHSLLRFSKTFGCSKRCGSFSLPLLFSTSLGGGVNLITKVFSGGRSPFDHAFARVSLCIACISNSNVAQDTLCTKFESGLGTDACALRRGKRYATGNST